MIGEFEYLVLAACESLGVGRAYGATIASRIEEVTGKRCSSGALYVTLDRLTAKGLVTSRLGDPTAERGGRAKRLVSITGAGQRAAGEFHRTVTRATGSIEWKETTNASTHSLVPYSAF